MGHAGVADARLGEIEEDEILQIGQGREGVVVDERAPQLEPLHLRELGDMGEPLGTDERPHHVHLVDVGPAGEGLEAGVPHLAVLDGEATELGEPGEELQAAIADARAAELHSLQARHLRHVLDAGVGNERAAAEIEDAELRQRRQIRQARVGEIVVQEDELLEPLHLCHRRQCRVGHVARAAEVQHLEIPEPHQRGEAGIVDVGVLQHERFQAGELRDVRHAGIGDFSAPQLERLQASERLEDEDVGIGGRAIGEIDLRHLPLGAEIDQPAAGLHHLDRLDLGRERLKSPDRRESGEPKHQGQHHRHHPKPAHPISPAAFSDDVSQQNTTLLAGTGAIKKHPVPGRCGREQGAEETSAAAAVAAGESIRRRRSAAPSSRPGPSDG